MDDFGGRLRHFYAVTGEDYSADQLNEVEKSPPRTPAGEGCAEGRDFRNQQEVIEIFPGSQRPARGES